MSIEINQILTNIRKINTCFLRKDNKEQNTFIITSKRVVSLLFQLHLKFLNM